MPPSNMLFTLLYNPDQQQSLYSAFQIASDGEF